MSIKPAVNFRHHALSVKPLCIALLIIFYSGFTSPADQIYFEEYSYSGISLDISAETENARATSWKPDGSKIFVTGRFTENVASYDLPEHWSLETATFSGEFDLSNELGLTSQRSRVHGLYLRNDGKKMWVFNRTEIWGYTLEVPWELPSASNTYYKDLSDFVERGHDFDFTPDGSRIFIDDRNARAIHEVTLATPWDVTTLNLNHTLDISDQEVEVRGLEIIKEGTIMLLMDTGRKEILQYQMSTPYDLKTARFIDAFDVSGQTGDPRGLSVHPSYDYFYVTGRDDQKIYQFKRQLKP